MRRFAVIFLLAAILLCGCQNDHVSEDFDNTDALTLETTVGFPDENPEIYKAINVLQAFFDDYAVADYDGMRAYSTDHAIEQYFHDFDVYGNVTAQLQSLTCERLESEYQIVLYVHVAINPVAGSALYGTKETAFYVRLLKEQEQWRVYEFFTGF